MLRSHRAIALEAAMKKALWTVLVLLAVAVPALAQEVHIDYDRWARFTTFKTFAWVDSPENTLADSSPLMHERIKATIINQLSSGRLKLAESDPDLYVTYYTRATEQLRVSTMSLGYGYPGSWYWDPYWGGAYTATTATTYTQGTLIIDIWDAKAGTLVWRASASAVVSSNPEKNAKKIEKACKKMAEKWQKMKPGF
jgi:Domain of unknown function (DUF4136)